MRLKRDWCSLGYATQTPGRNAQGQPTDQESQTAERRHDPQFADAAEGQRIQAAGKQHDADGKGKAGPGDQSTGNLGREYSHAQQGQRMHQLVKHTGVKNRQILGAQATFEAVGSECAEGYAGKTEKGSKHQEATKHQGSPVKNRPMAHGLYNGPLNGFGQAISMLRFLLHRVAKILLWFAAGSLVLVLVLRWVPPPGTALMIERKIESWVDGEPIDLQRSWQPWNKISDNLKIAVIAGEDQKFAEHWGFDISAIQAAILHNERGGSIRGASTLSQQVSKNLFLWSGRSYLRKALEAWFTALIELLWSKERILEVYLNSVEWDEGVFGAQAAAQHHFGINASALSTQQASYLAAVLPNPRQWSASHPSSYVSRRAGWIRQQMRQLGGDGYLAGLNSSRKL
ncbi:Monofunctional biosynthetic peptidoglycan transglycosylase [Pseudomonas cichorii]|uniref:Biosynthetic peptidoglycan transglycosylase n=2 Tax=Pseudomonas cichorii TaxID=36746 RepID=A0A3M4WEK7_PSECI|nr:Monofunctional biosynthetic peptidoglycan transglycosylase [Pseudomonas cichorii]